MNHFPFYREKAEAPLQIDPTELTPIEPDRRDDPMNYLPDPGLVDAVNVSVLLGQPLLVTGEPGTGKTELAKSVAWQLGFSDKPLKFETKSTSIARDLFYSYDTLSRFHAAHTGQGSQSSLDYLTYNALGIALLRAKTEVEVQHLIPKGSFEHGGQRRSVVLVDEIDKAPRDFPNDILNEVDGMYFRIPELKNEEVRAPKTLRPILILTSNSEKHLPDAFLRRCIYYNIPFPDKKAMLKIVKARMGDFADDSGWLATAFQLFYELREPNSGLIKKPATAELLNWLTALPEFFQAQGVELNAETLRGKTDSTDPDQKRLLVEKSLSTLIKLSEDRDRASIITKLWSKKPPIQK